MPLFTDVDRQLVWIKPEAIVTIRPSHFSDGASIVTLSNGERIELAYSRSVILKAAGIKE